MSNLYETKDQQIATVLYGFKERLLTTEWRGNSCFFIFENQKRCEEKVMRYFTNELRINPRLLFDSLSTIKTIIHQK